MKHCIPFLLLVWVGLSACQQNCLDANTYWVLEPEYISYDEVRSGVKMQGARELRNPGKLYFKDGFIFVNERDEGIHVIDNREPSQPRNLAFLKIPGNSDLAIKGNYLYADSYVDLLTLDVSQPEAMQVVERLEDVLPAQIDKMGFRADPSKGLVKGWKAVERKFSGDCEDQFFIDPIFTTQDILLAESGARSGEIANGVGGSLARFTLMKGHLYAVTSQDLLVFDLINLAAPSFSNKVNIGWEIETIFPFKQNLLIGSQFGMYIYDTSDPKHPTQQSVFQHMRSCDPVVAEGDLAFVTLRSGTVCPGGNNQLDILNISEVSHPQLLRSYPLTEPYGLGIRNDVLYICEGDAGLRVFDASLISSGTSLALPQIAHFPGIHAFDVIPLHGLLLMIGDDGLYQYDVSEPKDIRLVSSIPVGR